MVTILTAVPRSWADAGGVTVVYRAFPVPAFEDGFGSQLNLFNRVLRKLATGFL
jgi:hypothetical protein